MGRVVAVLAAMALVGMLVFVGMTIDLALHGAYVSGGVERFPGAEMVAGVSGAIAPLGLLALPLGTVLGLVLTLRGREWVWLVVIFTLFPVAGMSMLAAGFVANIPAALLTLPAPVALVIYCALARRARLGGSGIARRGR
jgi:small-conductance mechanosensitive channel